MEVRTRRPGAVAVSDEYTRWNDEFEDARMLYSFYRSVLTSYGDCPEWGELPMPECFGWMNVAALARTHLCINVASEPE